jgi:LacI family transcriptional regulator
MATSNDIAKCAGVSQATVSRVLRDHQNVSASTRARVLRVIEELNYRPNGIARAMRTSRTDTIGVVVARLSNPLYPELLDMLNRALSELGKRMVVWDSEGSGEIAASEAIRQSIVDGVLFTTATANSTVLYEAIRASAPVVLVNRTVQGLPCDQVSSDNAGGGALVASYFVDNKRRRIAFISGDIEPSTIRERETGFLTALEKLGSPLDPRLHLRSEFSHDAGRRAMRSLLELATPPDAVFCVNDVVAFGALDAAVELGCQVPEDVWLVGFDDVEMASWSMMSLTTVRQPLKQLIDDGVRLLLQRIAGGIEPPQQICHPTELVLRGSTAHAPFSRIPAAKRLALQ